MAKRLINTLGLTEAKAIQLLRYHNKNLIFKGFSKVGDATPAATLNHSYIATETGIVFGLSVVKGQILVGNGSAFYADTMQQKADEYSIKQRYLQKFIGKNKLKINDENFLTGYYISSAGSIGPNSTYSVTGFIEINEGETFVKNGSTTSNIYTAFYDGNFNLITGSQISNNNLIPHHPGAKYFRTTIYASESSTIQIELGTVTTDFVRYTEMYQAVSEDSIQDQAVGSKALKDGSVTTEKLETDYKKLLVEKYVKQSDTVTKHYDGAASSSIEYPDSQGYAWAMAFVPDSNITINGSYLKPTRLLDEVHICLLEISPTNVITVLQEHDITKKWNKNIGQVAEFFFDDANLVAGTIYAIGQKSADLTTHIGFYSRSIVTGVSQKRPRIWSSAWILAVDATTVMYAIPSLFDLIKVKTSLNEDASIEGVEIAENTIGGSKFKDNSVSESKLAALSVSAEKIRAGAVTEAKTNFLIPTKNLFNKDAEDVTYDRYVAWASGGLPVNSIYNVTGFIPIVPGQTYTRSYEHQTAFYNLNKQYVSGLDIGSSPTFVAPENCYFVRCTVLKAAWETFQLEVGSQSTSFVAYGYHLPEKYLPVITPVKTFPNDIVSPKKQYLLSDYENTIYFQALTKRYRPQDEFVRIEGGEWINKKHMARITFPTVETANVNAKIYDIEFKQVASDGFDVVIGNILADNGLIKGIYVGDSLSYNAHYILKVNSLIPNLLWDGMRKSYSGEIYGEGRGGWRLSTYIESLTGDAESSFTPFMHPVDPYKYFGGTDFWKAVVNGATGYSNNGFSVKATEIGFDAATGLLINPAVDDCMYNNANARYERWNGSSWVEISAATLNFSFNFAKYRNTWNIIQPDIVTVMLGTNDFRSQPSESTIDGFWNEWQTRMETFAASVIADNPSAKFAILIPPTTCGSMDNVNGAFTMMQNAMMWYGRKLIIENFDKREAEGIYLVDVGRSIDPEYGFDEIEELPFSDYAGTSKRIVHGNPPHPNTAGYSQLAIPLAGWIQKVR